jgi:hypothetical protein
MDEKDRQTAFLSALTTEHFVLQTAANGTISEAAARASLYVFSLSSSLIAMGFVSRSREIFVPFSATVLPALFVLGTLTVVRLVDTALENMHFLTGIARIRSYYRTLTPEAALYFSSGSGRWPESPSEPSLRLGRLAAFLSTSASMLALINSLVAGVGATMLAHHLLGRDRRVLSLSIGVAAVVILMVAFLLYERWRFQMFEVAASREPAAPGVQTGKRS